MKDWIKSTALKTIKTMAQAAIGVIGSSAILSDVDWKIVISSVILAGVVCILMNVANLEVKEESKNE